MLDDYAENEAMRPLVGIPYPQPIRIAASEATPAEAQSVLQDLTKRLQAIGRTASQAIDSNSVTAQSLFLDDRLRWILARVQGGAAGTEERQRIATILQASGEAGKLFETWLALNPRDPQAMKAMENLRATGIRLAQALSAPSGIYSIAVGEPNPNTPQVSQVSQVSQASQAPRAKNYVEAERVEEFESVPAANIPWGLIALGLLAFVILGRK